MPRNKSISIGQRQMGIGPAGFGYPGKRWKVAKFENRRPAFRGTTITGEEKVFYLWRNSCLDLRELRIFCGQLLAEWEIEAQIGPAADVREVAEKQTLNLFKTTRSGRRVFGVYLTADDISFMQIIIQPSHLNLRDFDVRGGEPL